MRLLLLIVSAVDAGTAVVAYQNHMYGWGLWLSSGAGLALLVFMKLEDQADDAR